MISDTQNPLKTIFYLYHVWFGPVSFSQIDPVVRFFPSKMKPTKKKYFHNSFIYARARVCMFVWVWSSILRHSLAVKNLWSLDSKWSWWHNQMSPPRIRRLADFLSSSASSSSFLLLTTTSLTHSFIHIMFTFRKRYIFVGCLVLSYFIYSHAQLKKRKKRQVLLARAKEKK